MIYLIDFDGEPPGLYKRTIIKTYPTGRITTFTDTQVLISNPDLEAFATLANEHERPSFVTIKVVDVLAERMSIDAMKTLKHLILIGNTWILSALIRKVHADCFELSFGGGERLWTHTYGMGEPAL